jgi:YidC/Oxa1 family membrane protein insertase
VKYRKLIPFAVVLLTFHQFFVLDVYAYIDPVTGSAFLTLLAGAIAAGAMTLKFYWFKIKTKFSSDLSKENQTEIIDKSNLESGFVSEWAELKKINQLSQDERSIMFYAENKASMNHFRSLIRELTEKMNLQVCYVTSVKNDPIFSSKNQRILPFYIGSGTSRTKFFSTLKAKILVMDMPDLGRFHIKRSNEYPVHYIYLFHSMYSVHSYLRKGAIDNYDTIFCVGPHQVKEIRETEKVYGLKAKKLINYGYGRLDTLLQKKINSQVTNANSKDLIIIAPSYGDDNLLERCGVKLIDILLKSNFRVMLRPHLRTLRDSTKLIDSIKENFGKNPNFVLERGIIPFDSLNNSLCIISDWSGISLEYAFTFERPVIFIDVPKKVLNPNSSDIVLEPIEISIRNKIGNIVSPNNLEEILVLIRGLDKNTQNISERIREIRAKTVYNIGESAKIGAGYIRQLYNESKNSKNS